MTYLGLALLGLLGVFLRFGAIQWIPSDSFPWHHFICNLVGCFLIGVVTSLPQIDGTLRFVLIVGLLGGVTTFSGFAADALALWDAGRWGIMATYVVATNVMGLSLCYIGRAVI